MTVVWLPPPDWSEPVEERRRYHTDVLRGQDGTEQRRRLGARPRLSLTFRTQLMERGEAVRLSRVLEAIGAEWVTLPWWADVALVGADVAADATAVSCATLGRSFEVGPDRALLCLGSTLYRILTVEDVGPTALTIAPVPEAWPAGSEIVPLRRGRFLAPPRLAFLTDDAATFQLAMEAES